MILKPRIVFSSGIMATGKTTVSKGISRKVDNAIYLDRDDINQGNLHVAPTKTNELPSFEEYVAQAGIFPDHARMIQTPFGEMIKVDPHNAFYRRHIRDQSYLIQLYIGKTNLECGKIPIFDCITMRQIQDGTLRKFMEHPFLEGYPKCLIHFVADEGDLYHRAMERAESDPTSRARVDLIRSTSRNTSPLASQEAFHRFITEEQPIIPKELASYEHLLMNTSQRSIQQCIERCIEYISH